MAWSNEHVRILLEGEISVSGLLTRPANADACFVFAHGAGAGMTHPFMSQLANGFAHRGIATLRYQFPYMEQRRKRPDPPKLAHLTVRAAVAEAARLGMPLFAGGKSFGGRMTSQAQAQSPLEKVQGLVFLGFPLHPAGKPSTERAEHLFDVEVPMLFLQGTRDALAALDLLQDVTQRLGSRATPKLFQDADHSFHVPARTARTDAEVRAELLDTVSGWIQQVIAVNRGSPNHSKALARPAT